MRKTTKAGRKVKLKRRAIGPHTPRKRTTVGSKFLSLGALMFAAALVVGTSVPANTFMDLDAMTAQASSVNTGTADRVPDQNLVVSADAQTAPLVRDGYEVISYAQVLQLKYAGISYAYTATTGAVRWPFPYPVPITDGFGERVGGFHKGVDFVPGGGTPIYAIADGVVTTAGEDYSGYGNHVIIQHDLAGIKVSSLSAHMVTGSSPVTVGQQVKVGDFLGLVGDTGVAYGAHLHFEIHVDGVPVDPFAWLQANAVN